MRLRWLRTSRTTPACSSREHGLLLLPAGLRARPGFHLQEVETSGTSESSAGRPSGRPADPQLLGHFQRLHCCKLTPLGGRPRRLSVQVSRQATFWAFVLFIAVTMVSYIIFFLVPAEPARSSPARRRRPTPSSALASSCTWTSRSGSSTSASSRPSHPITFDGARPEAKEPSLGRSFATRQEVNKIVKAAAPVTVSLVFGGAILWMLIALPSGSSRPAAAIAVRQRRDGVRADRDLGAPGLARADPVVLLRLPARLDADSAATATSSPRRPACGGPGAVGPPMILPWITFAILFAALYVRMIRANVMETMNEDYVRTARAKGAPSTRDALARAPQRDAPGRDDARDGHRARARRRDLHRVGLRLTRPRAGRRRLRLERFDLPTVQGIVVFATSRLSSSTSPSTCCTR